ncbi:MAG: ribonuclease R [Bacteroidia bacterium]|nr:ribonuclease R [Bacteroidia bacterium]
MPRNQNPGKRKPSGKNKRSKTPNTRQEHQIQTFLVNFFREHRNHSFTVRQIAALTGLYSSTSNSELLGILDKLAKAGKLQYLDQGRYQYLDTAPVLEGRLQVTRSGAGFLIVADGRDVYIAADALGKALNGDTVRVRISGRRRSSEGRREGEVVEVLQRARTEFVGVLEAGNEGVLFLIPDDETTHVDFYIPADKTLNAKAGEKALVRLTGWERRSPEAEVIAVLGMAGAHETEMHAILLQYGFRIGFPDAVEREVETIPAEIAPDEIARRRDFRGVTTFTIDPFDAKDFDDALSLRILGPDHYEIGVHIADVSHYVLPGTELDREAIRRATSVYLVDRTVPMLPEKLSNFLCSLRPHEDKLCYSAVFEIDGQAKVLNYWIGRTIIHSDYRFYYEEAQEVLDGKRDGPFPEELRILDGLAKQLRSRRMGSGSIEFESNEVKFELDEQDRPVRVIRKQIQDTNRLIEDFMLLANRTVAEHIFRLFKENPLPSVYRIHDLPDPDKLGNLQNFAKQFGYESDLQSRDGISERLNALLRQVHGSPEQNVIESVAIRSMAKAVYSTKNIGHFGLGFAYYTHFTSPIRRYPDLMVHRLLAQYGAGDYRANQPVMEEQCKHCSDKEREAAEAERASIKYKQVEFLQDKIGKPFTGLISGVIEAGFFVELEEMLAEGFVPIRSMEDDYYFFDEKNFAMVGRTTERVLRLGDRVEVTVASTDLRRRRVDMLFVRQLPHVKPAS